MVVVQARLLAAVSTSSKAALVTSPGFGRAFAANLLATSALAAAAHHVPFVSAHAARALHAFQLATLNAAHRYAWWGAISLLSSSCCALQLLLNLASVGCAGFNRVLGPLRPFLLSVTLLLQLSMWRVALAEQPWQLPFCAAATLLTATLTFLPELLDATNRIRAARLARRARRAAGAPLAGRGLSLIHI